MATGSVLIIDDDEVDRYLLKRLLKEAKFSFDVFEADDGSSALDFLKNPSEKITGKSSPFPPTIIFLDINMPIMRGPEFLDNFAKVRSEIYGDSCVIMMFSSSERKEDRERALSYDFVKDYLVKGSFNSADLRARIQSVIAEASA